MGNERSTCCEKSNEVPADHSTDSNLLDGQETMININSPTNHIISNLKSRHNKSDYIDLSLDPTQIDTTSSKSIDTSMARELNLMTTTTQTHNNRVIDELSKTVQDTNNTLCKGHTDLETTRKKREKPNEFLSSTEEQVKGVTRDNITSQTLNNNIYKNIEPKLGTISGSTSEKSRTPSQSKEIVSYESKKDIPLSRMFPTLHSSSTTTKEQRISPSSSTSFRPHQPPRAPSFVPLKFPEIPKKSKDSKGDVIRFRSDYANKFAIGSRHTVDFFSGSFDEAQKEAKNSIRLILVFIHDPTNEDSAKFIHESLNSVEFGELVSRNQLIVWGVANDSDEGKYVAFYQHVFKFPFLGLMCPRGDGRFFTARRTSGFITAIDLIEKLQKSCDVLQSELKELRKQKEIIMENRRIMEEQEKAYKESAERDKQKILKAKKAREEKLEAEKKQQEKQKQMEQRRQTIAEKRGELKLQVEQQPTGNELVNVQVRFPSGKKFSKKFSLDDSLEKLFIAIFCYETCPDFFTVATGFPRSEIHCAPEWYHALLSAQLTSDGLVAKPFRQASSFRAAGLGRAVGVFVNNHGTNSDSY